MRLTCVTVDCADPLAVARFWSEALGWGGVRRTGEGIAVVSSSGGAFVLEFVAVPESKVVKNRLHLGTSAGALADLDVEIARLEELGATIAWEEEFPPETATTYRNVVMRDVEGNEFCLSGGAPPA